ncbi:SPOR domain-containing protein [Comamonas composti]|uniref:SPOR domain-containing protein n=1 Tax=Comamonas composti TaxID=408558 RepID=UPI00041D0EE4|nr:SPOR domain-containing protein [Comamonas composti]
MLRITFLLLVLANAGYYFWSHGHLAGLGLAPQSQNEPERLQRQIRPEALSLAIADSPPPPSDPQAVAAPSPAVPAETPSAPAPEHSAPQASAEPSICLQATGLDELQARTLQRDLGAQLNDKQWDMQSTHQPGRWMVYMGKFPDTDFLERKRAELRARNIDFDRAGGTLEPGLSLGRFSSEDAATRQLTQLTRQGVRSARVVQERPEITSYTLRLPRATPALRSQIQALGGKALEARPLKPC